jgi:hypothetical protein
MRVGQVDNASNALIRIGAARSVPKRICARRAGNGPKLTGLNNICPEAMETPDGDVSDGFGLTRIVCLSGLWNFVAHDLTVW